MLNSPSKCKNEAILTKLKDGENMIFKPELFGCTFPNIKVHVDSVFDVLSSCFSLNRVQFHIFDLNSIVYVLLLRNARIVMVLAMKSAHD